MRQYMDLLAESNEPSETAPVRKALGLKEGELIPLPSRVLRVPGAPFDFYQLLKMTANPNLAHKVNYKPTGAGKGGANVTDIMMMFYDDVSYEEAKKLFSHFGIPFTDAPELSSEIGRTSGKHAFKSKNNPPSEGDEMFGQYYKPVTMKP